MVEQQHYYFHPIPGFVEFDVKLMKYVIEHNAGIRIDGPKYDLYLMHCLLILSVVEIKSCLYVSCSCI